MCIYSSLMNIVIGCFDFGCRCKFLNTGYNSFCWLLSLPEMFYLGEKTLNSGTVNKEQSGGDIHYRPV